MNINHTFKSLLAETLRESANSYLVEKIVTHFNSPQQLLDVTEQELLSIRGIGKVKAKQIVAAIQLAKMMNVLKTEPTIIRSPRDVFEYLRWEIGYEQKEHFIVIFLSTKNHILGKETISIGSLNSAIVHPREVYKAAIRRSACSIIVSHNHPSQICTLPSPEDIQLTKRLAEAGEIIGIELLDHVIVSGSDYTSLKERGLL